MEFREAVMDKSVEPTTENTALAVNNKFIDHVILKLGEQLPNLPSIFISQDNKRQKLITFILPLSGRHQTFKRFIKMYENNCIAEQEHTRLIIVLYKNNEQYNEYVQNKNLVLDMQNKYTTSEITLVIKNETFSRGRALEYGVDNSNINDLLFFIDVDVIFDKRSLIRIRSNTVRSKNVYFPIVYSLYNPAFLNESLISNDYVTIPEHIIEKEYGFWRQFGFGIVSIYKSDFINLGGFNKLISGWGLEDVSFYDNVVKSNLKIVRSIDATLVHVYHHVECDSSLEKSQRDMCTGTKANTLGSLTNLQKYYMEYVYRGR